jgi:hypothetical protein
LEKILEISEFGKIMILAKIINLIVEENVQHCKVQCWPVLETADAVLKVKATINMEK